MPSLAVVLVCAPIAQTLKPLLLNVGLPKSGSTSLSAFLMCAMPGRRDWVAHQMCKRTATGFRVPCGTCIMRNIKGRMPPLQGCGEYSAITQLDWTPYHDPQDCIFPQVSYLEMLTDAYPDAVFTLPLRSSQSWASSVGRWNPKPEDPTVIFEQRMRRCNLPYLPVGSNRSLAEMYELHTAYIRGFFRNRPHLKLVEFDIASQSAGVVLATALGISKSKGECWARHNVGPSPGGPNV